MKQLLVSYWQPCPHVIWSLFFWITIILVNYSFVAVWTRMSCLILCTVILTVFYNYSKYYGGLFQLVTVMGKTSNQLSTLISRDITTNHIGE